MGATIAETIIAQPARTVGANATWCAASQASGDDLVVRVRIPAIPLGPSRPSAARRAIETTRKPDPTRIAPTTSISAHAPAHEIDSCASTTSTLTVGGAAGTDADRMSRAAELTREQPPLPLPPGRRTVGCMKRLAATVVTTALLVMVAASASGGGSWFEPIESDIEPGDSVTMVGFSGFGPKNDPDVGPDDPFYAYLEVDRSQRSVDDTYPTMHDGMIRIGEFVTTDTGQAGFQRYRLHVTFTVPADLTPGVYDVHHCNDPCTTTFGELIGGFIVVGDPTREAIAEWAGISVGQLDFQEWQPSRASLNDPLVSEVAVNADGDQLALTGTSVWLALVGGVAIVGGVLAVTTSRKRPRPA